MSPHAMLFQSFFEGKPGLVQNSAFTQINLALSVTQVKNLEAKKVSGNFMSIKCLKYSQGNCIADSKEIYKIPNAQN